MGVFTSSTTVVLGFTHSDSRLTDPGPVTGMGVTTSSESRIRVRISRLRKGGKHVVSSY